MKLSKKFIAGISAFTIISAAAVAQDFDFGGDSGFDSSYAEDSEPAVVISGKAEANARVYPQRDNSGFDTHDYGLDMNSLQNKAVSADPSLSLGIDYTGAFTDFSGKLKFDESILKNYTEDIVQEFTARAYVGNLQLEAGKMKLVWGKGDKVHVLDNFNSNDYTDFIIPDYIDRRLGLPMFHAVYNIPSESCLRLEAVYTPYMVADRLDSYGMWKPAKVAQLEDTIRGMITEELTASIVAAAGNSTAIPGAFSGLMNAAAFDASSIYPDTKTLKYGQAGLRGTFTLGSVDLGFSGYYGHYKQPSANLQNTIIYKALHTSLSTEGYTAELTDSKAFGLAYQAAIQKAAAAGQDVTQAAVQSAVQAQVAAQLTPLHAAYSSAYAGLPSVDYDFLYVFGLEGATVIGPFNTRAELAFNLTNDIKGDDPWVHNNSIAWEAGFDINLPVHNMNLNAQTTGKFILGKDKIKNGGIDVEGLGLIHWDTLGTNYDVDYDNTGKYMRNQVIVDITDNWCYEKIKLDLKGIYQIETQDLMVLPTLTFILADTFELNLSGLYIWCGDEEESEYYAWRNNDYFSIGCKYQF
ncbi:MAG: hypothetical protein J6Y93_03375 [Treponema sp.]|nr:hypothetical protein [Treponema sp.]